MEPASRLSLASLPEDVMIRVAVALTAELNGPAFLCSLSSCSAGLAQLLRRADVVDTCGLEHRHPQLAFYRNGQQLGTLQALGICEALANLGPNRVAFRQQHVLVGSRFRRVCGQAASRARPVGSSAMIRCLSRRMSVG
jgi:hypothetical protein